LAGAFIWQFPISWVTDEGKREMTIARIQMIHKDVSHEPKLASASSRLHSFFALGRKTPCVIRTTVKTDHIPSQLTGLTE
jgi:hypothetical protein